MEKTDEPTIPRTDSSASGSSRRRLIVAAVIAAAALVLVFLAGYIPRRVHNSEVEAAAARTARAVPIANVMKVKRAPAISQLLLPGTLTPLTESYIYARATGYVRKRYVDIGDRVKAGQVLAEIEAPDLDEQVGQAQATLAQAGKSLAQAQGALRQGQAQLELARVTWDRYKGLAAQGVIARQDADQALAGFQGGTATVQALEANVAALEQNILANRANLGRLLQLQSFEKVRAPFAGVITARNFDIGALISGGGSPLGLSTTPLGGTQNSGAVGTAGASTANIGSAIDSSGSPGGPSGSGGEMYRMAQIGVLRVLVDVPEESAPAVAPGQRAGLYLQAFPGRTFEGRLTRTANALSSNTHTLLTEVQMRNPDGKLLPGMYAQVKLASQRSDPPFLVPGSSLIIDARGNQIAVLDGPAEGDLKRVHLQPITIGRDYGTETEITDDLQGWEYIVVTPGDRIQEGALVKPAAAPEDRPPARQGARPNQPNGGTTASPQSPQSQQRR